MEGRGQGYNLSDVCAQLRLEEAFVEVLARGWEESERAMSEERLHFLQFTYIADRCSELHIDDASTNALQETAARIRSVGALVRLAWHIYWVSFESGELDGLSPAWPPMREALGLPFDLFYAVLILGAAPKARAAYQKRGIPASIVDESLGDIRVKMMVYQKEHGELGLSPGTFNFHRRLVKGEMIQVGRFQYHYSPFRGKLRAYRRIRDGAVVALSTEGVAYRSDGEFYLESRGDSSKGVWTSTFSESEHHIVGNPITPYGKCINTEVRLEASAWRCMLAPGDPVMQMHIPGGSPMEHAACGESLLRARDAMARYYCEHAFKAFACSSWLLDDQLEIFLPTHANLVRFLKEVYRFPANGSTASSLRWIFGETPKDLTNAPRNSTLRRRVIEHLLAGGELVGGGCFLLVDDLAWGSQIYRRQHQDGVLQQA